MTEDPDQNWLPPGQLPWPNPCKRENYIMPGFGPEEEYAELERQKEAQRLLDWKPDEEPKSMSSASPSQDGFPGCCLMFCILLVIFAMCAAVAFGNEPAPDVLRERVSCIEVNNFYSGDETGIAKHVFTQILFRDQDSNLIAWRMVAPVLRMPTEEELLEDQINAWQIDQGLKPFPFFQVHPKFSETRLPMMTPRYDHARSLWVCEWFDGSAYRRVEAVSMVETFTEYDPELSNRDVIPNGARVELRAATTRGKR